MSNNFKTAILAGSMATLFAGSAMAYDVRIDINGKLTSSTCEITGVTGKQATITLPDLDVQTLKDAGSVAGRKRLDLDVTGCQDTTKAIVHFESSAMNVSSTGNLLNTAVTDAAENVEVQLLDGNSNVLDLNTDSAEYQINGATGVVTLYAQYYAPLADAVTAGDVSSHIEISMSYE